MRIQRLEGELEKAANETIIGLQKQYEAAQDHENSVRQMYLEQRGTTDQQTRDQIEMAAYTQRLETNKQYLNTLLQKQREVQIAQGDKGSEVSIENYSRVPRSPVGPPRLRNVMVALCCRWSRVSVWRSCSISLTTQSSRSTTSIATSTCRRWR